MSKSHIGSILVLASTLAASWVLTACSSANQASAADTICAFAENTDNCWHQLVNDVQACAGSPQAGAQGTLNADNTVCTYADGRTITFNTPLDFSMDSSNNSRDFTVTVNGQQCLHYVETNQGITVTGPAGKVLTESYNAAAGATSITCPDGSSYQGSVQSVLSCMDASFNGLPGTYWSGDDHDQSLGLTGGDFLYDCHSAS